MKNRKPYFKTYRRKHYKKNKEIILQKAKLLRDLGIATFKNYLSIQEGFGIQSEYNGEMLDICRKLKKA